MRTDFQLMGLGLDKDRHFTCSVIGEEEFFWPKSGIPEERFQALWDWAKNSEGDFWKMKWITVIEHNGFFEDGTPRHPVVVEVKMFESVLLN